jgi:hypothetical protein
VSLGPPADSFLTKRHLATRGDWFVEDSAGGGGGFLGGEGKLDFGMWNVGKATNISHGK